MRMQFKIQLDHIVPAIWRRFGVPSDISLHTFHEIIQTIMGWSESHLYAFSIGTAVYEVPSRDPFDDRSSSMNSKKTSLESLTLIPKQKIKYEYDFGDGWTHSIVFEKDLDDSTSVNIPLCIDGKRNCPPEDCGSFPGYEELCKAMREPESERAKELIHWLGGVYDPEYFNLAEVNSDLRRRFGKTKRK